MKATLWLAAAVLFLVTRAAAEESPPPRELGVLDPVQAEVRIVAPKGGFWNAPECDFVCPDSVSVHPKSGPPLVRREGQPRLGQFTLLPRGIALSPAQAGQEFTVRYQFRPRRVALLEAATPTNYPDALSVLGQALAEELDRRGFVVVPAQEVREAAAALGLGAVSPHALPPAEKLAALAREVNAAYVLAPGVAIRQHSKPGDFDTGIPIPSKEKLDRLPEPYFDVEKASRPPRSVFDEEPTLILSPTRYRLYGGMRLVVVEGATGTVVHDKTESGSQRVRWQHFASARRSLVRTLAAQVVALWRGPTP